MSPRTKFEIGRCFRVVVHRKCMLRLRTKKQKKQHILLEGPLNITSKTTNRILTNPITLSILRIYIRNIRRIWTFIFFIISFSHKDISDYSQIYRKQRPSHMWNQSIFLVENSQNSDAKYKPTPNVARALFIKQRTINQISLGYKGLNLHYP